jgi:hypothetical protein
LRRRRCGHRQQEGLRLTTGHHLRLRCVLAIEPPEIGSMTGGLAAWHVRHRCSP